MPALKMTPTRLALLRAVADPTIDVSAAISGLRGSWSTADVWLKAPGEVHRKVTKKVDELEVAGLVKRASAGVRYHQPRRYSLTEAGAKVLAELGIDAPGEADRG
jgi:DNA-binding transcriptional ArsR family regulator